MTTYGYKVVVSTILALAPCASACELHSLMGLPEPVGVWPSIPITGVQPLGGASSPMTVAADGTVSASAPLAVAADTALAPTVTAWKLATGARGHSTNPTINSYVSTIIADVDRVAYDNNYVYMHSSDVPSHDVGPFPGNPAYPSDKNQTYRIPLNPTPATTHTNVGLGAVGVMVNGVALFNALDAATYNNGGTWHQIANVFEASSFDAGKGHPAPGMGPITPGVPTPGTYHYHQTPAALVNQIDPGNTGQHHSPILGFAFDGYPIYGSYGYANADGTGGIIHETSSYQLRGITQRHTLANGTVLSSAQWGPDVSATYPLGDYQEDYQYVPGSGTLDQYDGRFVVTPDYPKGTYAYFLPMDANGNNVYPYTLAPQYYGVVDTADTGQGSTITVPAGASFYFVLPEPALGLGLTGVIAVLATGRRR